MYSLGTIKSLSDEAAAEAAQAQKKPYVLWKPEELDSFPPFPFPFIGDYVPDGWERLEDGDWFVDSSGLGAEGELALTAYGFIEAVKEFLRDNADRTVGFAIYEQGQFQVKVAAYLKRR